MAVNNHYYKNIIEQIADRSVEATISILGVTDEGLRLHLAEEFNKQEKGFGLLADPIFESMFPWEKSDKRMKDLSGNLLLPSLIKAMDSASEHKFGKDWFPYKHQLKAWSSVLDESNKSMVVTSGTGSGKTECFMVPILNDLACEYEKTGQPLIGVRALFLYPLNALINSQRERLRAWTDAYDDGLRFCLYNGNTEERKHKDQGKYPNEILTRQMMRDAPAPMLVTNATMLEYMLVRQIDEPIIEESKGKLRWIILDEAHTYIGSQAAEISLLLRRVLHAFGVKAKDVRFIATSATIGDKGSAEQLQQYLAKLAGIKVEQVVVVGADRLVPKLATTTVEKKSLTEIGNIDKKEKFSEARYSALSAHPLSTELRKLLTDNKAPSSLFDLSSAIFKDSSQQDELLSWVDLCSNTSLPGNNKKDPSQESTPFLPLRGHLFHQVLSGLWCCVDKNCSSKKDTFLSDDWAFGRVYSKRKNHCDCGAPIFELSFCNECNTPHLIGIESGGYLIQTDRNSVDEFSLDYEGSEEDDEDSGGSDTTEKMLIAPLANIELTFPLSIDSQRKLSSPSMESFDLNILDQNNMSCSSCGYSGFKSGFYRRSLLGTPFYISNTVPTLLDACQESEQASDRPNRGKRLITFTDSRQGTARISVKIQQDAERDSIRGLVYAEASNHIATIDDDERGKQQEKLDGYLSKSKRYQDIDAELASDLQKFAADIQQKLDADGAVQSLSWKDAVFSLQTSPDISRWIFDYYRGLNPQLFPESGGAAILADLGLLREFARRPKRQNSLETLGLVSVQYPVLKEIKKVPSEWQKLNLTLSDWTDFLKVILDFYIRENSIIGIPPEWVDWMGAKVYPKTVVNPNSEEETNSRIKRWPQVNKGRKNRLVLLLSIACDLDFDAAYDKDVINNILLSAWKALTKDYQVFNEKLKQIEGHRILKNEAGSIGFHLDRHEMAFEVCTEAWICPFTHRLIDTTFKGLTPYLPMNAKKEDVLCRKFNDIPVNKVDASEFLSDIERKQAIRKWVAEQPNIALLRSENLWTDISDRVVEGGRFYRAAEHSAQQGASALQKYEAMFKKGKMNVLSCSTTMEMGVDIGGISVVAMNNVPPHPANYLQRSGRAGRRGETQALSFTICKDNPHERAVFVDPSWPFTTSIPAPYIILNSDRIVQRHINSLILSYFLKNELSVGDQSITSLQCQWFFDAEDGGQAPIERMLRWIESFKHESMPEYLQDGVTRIIKESVLANVSFEQIIDESIDVLETARDKWLPGYQKLKNEFSKVEQLKESDPFRKKVSYDLKCMGEGYLLSELASKAFLPGYGFPTGIATFDHYSISDYKKGKFVKGNGRIDNRTRMRERPGRDLPVAIREYAPGADIVLDGLVYRSAGLLLNKFSPNEDYSQPQKMVLEWRCHICGFISNDSSSTFDKHCSDCGTELRSDHIKEYIEPIGFAVDFYSSPTTDITSQKYIPVQEPWVTAESDLEQLFEPKLGTYRSSSQGHIFHHSSGENNQGFAVCMRCGKAESMDVNGDFPRTVSPGIHHNKLQGKPGPEATAACEGPDEAYAIKGNVHLGATDQTDIFELYLKKPQDNSYIRHDPNDESTRILAWTLAVTLRQTLADIHGINADEIGYTVKPSILPTCAYPVAGIVLFDRSGGGAGFSSVAPRFIHEMLLKTLKQLDCSDNCDSACQACLLGFDTRFHIDLLNRHVAIEYIESILPYLEIPPEAKIFGNESKYCLESLSAEILLDASKGASKLSIYSEGSYDGWDMSISKIKASCLNWLKSFDCIELVLPDTDMQSMSDVHKEDLRSLSNFGVHLRVMKQKINLSLSGASLLVQTTRNGLVTSYGSNDSGVNTPNENWWRLEGNYLVKSESLSLISTSELNLESLVIGGNQLTDIEIEIKSECDGRLNDFGTKLWNLIISKSIGLESKFASKNNVIKVEYSDSYISSAWSLMLLVEFVDGLKTKLDDRWNGPEISLITGDKNPNNKARGFYAEWGDRNLKTEVIKECFDQMGENINVGIRSMKEMPHGRFLTLSWSDGSISIVRFDHGIGCWSIDKRPSTWLDINAKPFDQVKNIFKAFSDITLKYNNNYPTQVFIKNR
ncbi:MAG: DEAD/DEAH box helicase [Cycloclasticus sp.]|nr:DEAD/DEAH box helicase [Cycloclasticus sp.]